MKATTEHIERVARLGAAEMTVLEILSTGLDTYGYSGLVNPGVCGCLNNNLSPASCLCSDCRPGYQHVHSKTGEWIVSTEQHGVTDTDIEECLEECG